MIGIKRPEHTGRRYAGRSATVLLMLLCLLIPAYAAEEKGIKVKVLPPTDVRMGFTDVYPEGSSFDFKDSGKLALSQDGQNLQGTFYVYHTTNVPKYTITLEAGPMKAYAAGSGEPVMTVNADPMLLGYEMQIGSAREDVYPACVNGEPGIPAIDGMFPVTVNTAEGVFNEEILSNVLKADNIVWRSLNINIPLGEKSIDDLITYLWKAQLRITFNALK